ncbi:MAG: tetratricopeptide repeat protein [Ignavibacteria bacterium]|nr:tetratricopeptide repeat protein [Ignavibacteria bacterium]
MKTRLLLSAVLPFVVLAAIAPRAAAQEKFAFGMENFVSADDAFAKVSVPAAAWATLVKAGKEGITDKDACLPPQAGSTMNGYQADYDGDGKEEMLVLFSNTAAVPACNVLAVLSPASGGTFLLHDIMTLPAGTALLRPVVTLETGVQFYVQCTYPLPEGGNETKGFLMSTRENIMLVLAAWTQKNFMLDGKKMTQNVRAALCDVNYDNRKELFLDCATHASAGGKLTEKNMTDRYIITLDFLPNQLRYGVYDSSGIDKVKLADAQAAAGQRMIGRDETRDDGILKIREALRVNPFMSKTRVRLGQYFLNAGKYSDAEKTLSVAKDFEPSYAKAWKLLGDTYVRLNDLQKALEVYTRYLTLIPKDSQTMDARQVRHNVKQITVWRRK